MEYKHKIATLRESFAADANVPLEDIIVSVKPFVANEYYEDDEPDTRDAVEVLFYYSWRQDKPFYRLLFDTPAEFKN